MRVMLLICFVGLIPHLCLPFWLDRPDPCDHDRCSHGGKCHTDITKFPEFYRCDCPDEYYGSHCENRNTHCDSKPCLNGGTCFPTHSAPYYRCECHVSGAGFNCEIPTTPTPTPAPLVMTTTSPVPPTSDTRTPVRPTTIPTTTLGGPIPAQFACNKYTSVLAIANSISEHNANATPCPSGTYTSPEAYVLTHCDTPLPKTWFIGQRVMDDCKSIPHYTPVFSITNNKYDPKTALSGILVECTDNPVGFKMAVQFCDEVPHIEYVTSSGNNTNMDANTYFIVL